MLTATNAVCSRAAQYSLTKSKGKVKRHKKPAKGHNNRAARRLRAKLAAGQPPRPTGPRHPANAGPAVWQHGNPLHGYPSLFTLSIPGIGSPVINWLKQQGVKPLLPNGCAITGMAHTVHGSGYTVRTHGHYLGTNCTRFSRAIKGK